MALSINTAWGLWLEEHEWDYWATLTFRDAYSGDAATRAFDRLIRWGRRLAPDLGYFVGHEVGKLGRLHLHALFSGAVDVDQVGVLNSQGLRSKDIWHWWFKRYGRAQVLPYDPTRGAAAYVSKYVTKEMGHYDVANLRGADPARVSARFDR